MHCQLRWSQQAVGGRRDGSSCTGVSFQPSGLLLAASVGTHVVLQEASSGKTLHTLSGHEAPVSSLSWSHDGQLLASGSSEGVVIVWNIEMSDILISYAHGRPIAAVAFSPTGPQLASVSAGELALWSPESQMVFKDTVQGTVMSLCWSPDGAAMALGQEDGLVAVRNAAGSPKETLEGFAGTPVACLAWCPSSEGKASKTIALCGGDGSLGFIRTSGGACKRARLGYAPRSISCSNKGDSFLIGSNYGRVLLYSRDGLLLGPLSVVPSGLSQAVLSPDGSVFALACEDGSVALYSLSIPTMHCVHGDRFVQRESLTDVVVQHLVTGERIRIRCRDHVHRLALHERRLAVALPQRVAMYELPAGASDSDLRYKLAGAIQVPPDSDVGALLLLADHVLVSQEANLLLYGVDGALEREWKLQRPGCALGAATSSGDAILACLQGGQAVRIGINDNSCEPLISHTSTIMSLQVCMDGSRVAALDDTGELAVFDAATGQQCFSEPGVESMAFNTAHDQVMCWSREGQLYIKTGSFPPQRLRMQGSVVRFKGCKLALLAADGIVREVEVPQSAGLQAHVAAGNWGDALRIADLGVTEGDWRALGAGAAAALQLPIARTAFEHLSDERGLELLQRVERHLAVENEPPELCIAEVLAHQGKVKEAADVYARAGAHDRAVAMFNKLNMFEEAVAFQKLHGAKMQQQEDGRQLAHITSLMQAGNHEEVVATMAAHGWWDRLAAYVQGLEDHSRDGLRAAADVFAAAGRFDDAATALLRLDDKAALVQMYVGQQKWQEALEQAHGDARLIAEISLPMAQWHLERGHIDEARAAFRDAGAGKEGQAMLLQLVAVAVKRRRFALAASLHQDLAMDALALAARPEGAQHSQQPPGDTPTQFWMAQFALHYRAAEDFTAFALVVRASEEREADIFPETLFGAARFLLQRLLQAEAIQGGLVAGIEWPLVVRTVAETAQQLGAFRLARFAWAKLRTLDAPSSWKAHMDVETLKSKGLPMTDAEELLPVCFRCGATNNLAGNQGDVCATCSTTFLRSFVTYDHLPIVAFEMAPGISHDEALRLLAAASPPSKVAVFPFGKTLQELEGALVADRETLRKLRREEVLVRRWPHDNIPPEFFYLVDTSLPLAFAPDGRCYEQDELDMWCEREGYAPFAVSPADDDLRSIGVVTPPSANVSTAAGPVAVSGPSRGLKYSHTMERSNIAFQASDIIEIH